MADGALMPLLPAQRGAAEPDRHVWLGASAGTGKTQVLSARVLRLLLDGVAPDAILCITFTKAGAAEMAHRVQDRLARWVQMDAGFLRADLQAIGARHDDPAVLAHARTLFARVIDAPGGGIRIQTIHSFCQSLLASFPIEAEQLPGFRLIDDGEADALRRATFAELIVNPPPGGATDFAAILDAMARRMDEAAMFAFLGRCAAAFAHVSAPPTREELRAALGLPAADVDAWLSDACAAAVDDGDCAAIVTAGRGWGTKTGLGYAEAAAALLASDSAGRAAAVRALHRAISTADGTLRKDFAGDTKMGAAADAASAIFDGVSAIKATADAMHIADELADAWIVGSEYARRYAAAKQARGLADYDDLINQAAGLLRGATSADWIRFKLDQRIDHLLVDEAQDTNHRQWQIIWALIEEFFAGEGAKDGRRRTLFTVGDRKQAIFSFQGTNPQAFADWQRLIADVAAASEDPVADIELETNFRSAAAMLRLVDAWIERVGADALGIDVPIGPHRANVSRSGRVELWPPIRARADDGDADEGDDEDSEGDEDSSAFVSKESDAASCTGPATDTASMRLSTMLARQIGEWIAHGIDGDPVAAGDIMILVRSRRDLAERIVARLQAADIPVAGVDRFALSTPLAVRDLIAAMRFAVQPLDDLNLAALLVSPLIGWTQEELLARGYREKGVRLWPHLGRQDGLAAALDPLWSILRMADLTTPHVFLETILSGPLKGREKLLARLGAEARDPIDELVQAALDHAARDVPTLAGFLAWFDAGQVDIKRQTAPYGGLVRVMTVHGSKGLQAPIVILADAAAAQQPTKGGVAIDLGDHGTLPLLFLSRAERRGPVQDAYDKRAKADSEEHWRLLYVALTRAERMLVVTGTLGARADQPPESSWYRAVADTLADMDGARTVPDARWGEKRVLLSGGGKWSAGKTRRAPSPVAIPGWARRPAPEEARPPRPLAPSRIGVDDAGEEPPDPVRIAAAERGRLMHSLFERLPDVAPAARADAARRWLARHAPGREDRDAIASAVLAVLADPVYADLFAPGALAEVPLTAVVDGLVVSGIADRLHVADDAVHVIDYKTGLFVPAAPEQVAPAYLRQMAAYHAALAVIFPGRRVTASLLYTAGPRLITLDAPTLAQHKPGFVEPNKS